MSKQVQPNEASYGVLAKKFNYNNDPKLSQKVRQTFYNPKRENSHRGSNLVSALSKSFSLLFQTTRTDVMHVSIQLAILYNYIKMILNMSFRVFKSVDTKRNVTI